jgi:hypothetical protein
MIFNVTPDLRDADTRERLNEPADARVALVLAGKRWLLETAQRYNWSVGLKAARMADAPEA